MKKLLPLLLLLLVIIAGCGNGHTSDTPSESSSCPAPATYTFSGESAQFALVNGRLTLNENTPCNEKETIDGGTLCAKNKDVLADVTGLTATLYVDDDSGHTALLSHSHSHDGATPMGQETHLGHAAGSTSLFGTKLLEGKDLKNHFFLEVTLTKKDGSGYTEILPLTLERHS